MMRRRRAPGPALTREEERGLARDRYIERFLDNDTMRTQLAALHERHATRPTWPAMLDGLRWLSTDPADAALVADCDAFARRLRLPDLAGRVYAWLLESRGLPTAAALRMAAPSLGASAGSAADIGDVEVARAERVVEGGRRIVEIDRRPVVSIVITTDWYPDHESRRAAEDRLLRLARRRIGAELDRIEAHAADLGYRFPDTRRSLDRDIRWLVWRVRDGLTFAEIANRAAGDAPDTGSVLSEDAVRHAVQAAADLVGLVEPES